MKNETTQNGSLKIIMSFPISWYILHIHDIEEDEGLKHLMPCQIKWEKNWSN